MAELGGTEGANGAAVIPGVCVIWVDPSTYYEPLDIADWNDERTTYCTLIAHEVGHLLGYGHAWWPRSVMHPLEVGNYPTRPCLRRFDRRLYRDAKRDIGTFAFRYSPGLR